MPLTENANLKAFQEHQCRETVCLAWLKELQKDVRQTVNTAAIAGIANGLGMMAQAAVLAFIKWSVIFLVSYSKNETKGVGTLRIGVLFENKQPLALEVFPL